MNLVEWLIYAAAWHAVERRFVANEVLWAAWLVIAEGDHVRDDYQTEEEQEA